jgi:sorbitol/mannitol transport system substrate-binding protein
VVLPVGPSRSEGWTPPVASGDHGASSRAISRRTFLGGAAAALSLAACGTASASRPSKITLRVAIVSNSQMDDAISLSSVFETQHPGIRLKFVNLPENEARAKITADVATQGGEFDVVMISNYETPLWAKNGWLVDLDPYIERTPGYDPGDFVPRIRQSLSYRGHMYSVPFYGESSFVMYRKDLFDQAGAVMPAHPTWYQIAALAKRFHNPASRRYGIVLRGDPGWGENLAPIDTAINAFGGRWYNMRWEAQLTTPPVERAVVTYIDTLRAYGEPGASADGFTECGTLYSQGDAAMWYDATSATSVIEDPASSKVVGKNGYAWAPTQTGQASGWLYTWSLSMPTTTPYKQQAWEFMSWMTSKSYIELVGHRLGWSHVPPGSRLSSYRIPQYRRLSKRYGPLTIQSIQAANPKRPTVKPVPYTGVQFLDIPEFQDLGQLVSEQFSAAIAGQISVQAALAQSQQYAQTVGATYRQHS